MTAANFLIAVACGLLWANLVAPAVLRAFGLPVAFGIWRIGPRNQNLTKTQYVWGCGVFMWGLGMFLFFVIAGYLTGSHWALRFPALVAWLTAGWLIGIFGARAS